MMPAVREAAAELAAPGRLAVTLGSQAVDALRGGNPIRLGRATAGRARSVRGRMV